MNPPASTRSYYPALDGLRGIAIILVICCHNFNFLPYFEFGWIGVDLFFVLSGFLITDILLKTKDNKNFLQNFYTRRALRIFPLYYGVLILFFILAPAFHKLDDQYNYYHDNQLMSWLHMQNWLSIFNQPPNNSSLLNHFWSLSVEEQFYLIWPFVILALKNQKQLSHFVYLLIAICIISRFSSWFFLGDGYTNFQFQYMTRTDGLGVGSLIAIWRMSGYKYSRRRVFQFGAVIFSVHIILFGFAKTIPGAFPYFRFIGYTSIAALLGIAIFFAAEKRNRYSKLLIENSLLKYTGKISYGLYVYHWPILSLTKIYLPGILTNHGFSNDNATIIIPLFSLILTVLVSIISYHLVEKRINALKEIVTSDGFFVQLKRKILLIIKPAPVK